MSDVLKDSEQLDSINYTASLKGLARALQRSTGTFALFFIECNVASLLEKTLQKLQQDFNLHPACFDVTIDRKHKYLDDDLKLLAKHIKAEQPVFISGLQQYLPALQSEQQQLITQVTELNWRRNYFKEICHPLVFCLPTYALTLLAQNAPDFYDWYSGVFFLKASTQEEQDRLLDDWKNLTQEYQVHPSQVLTHSKKQQEIRRLIALLDESNSREDIAYLEANIARLFFSVGDYNTALDYMERSLIIRQEIGDRTGEGATLNNISQIYNRRGDYATALDYLQRSLTINQEIGDRAGEGATLNNISGIYDRRGDYATALDYLQRSLTIRKEIGDRAGEGTTLNNISQIYKRRGDDATALDYLQRSLTIRQEIGDRAGEGTTLNNISQIYKRRGDDATALDYLQRSLTIRQEIGDRAGEGTVLNNISQIYSERGDYATALDYLQRSLTIRQEIGDRAGEGTVLNNISGVYDRRGDYATALDYLQRSLTIRQEIGDLAGEGITLFNLAVLMLSSNKAANDIGKARSYMQRAEDIAASINSFELSHAIQSFKRQIK